ncbi:AraC family transcriptional regulator [Antribacter sp. KLBMP9083]|uniref:AraC family transcriptional regulator n=1 Tax=Antribacter soli TaxID=2910976 RepID=A0AA41QE20_9MICO|nr:AraC family transcriptional regulator [Antribacter soli]MCF4120891.1 AraC family transcriptional regulator [Antribacter soli]
MVVLEAESADTWEAVVSGCFVPLNCAGFEPDFTGRMEHTALDERLSVSLVTTCGTSAERSPRLAARAATDDLHLSLQRSSTGRVVQDGRVTPVRPGSVTVYATDRPYYLDYSPPGQQQLIVQVSGSSLGLPARMIEAATARLAVPSGQRSSAAGSLFSYVAALAGAGGDPAGAAGGERGDGPRPGEAADVARDLAQVMIRASFGGGPVVPRTAGGLRHTVQEFLRAHATTPGLDVEEVARCHFVSRRKLYQVFGEAGLAPAEFLRRERLRAAARLLRAGGPGARPVEQVAYACGFDDPTTFTRAFRRVYGCTPREWRARPAPTPPATL